MCTLNLLDSTLNHYFFHWLENTRALRTCLVAQLVKNPPAMLETWV